MIDTDAEISHLTSEQIQAGMEHVSGSPADGGPLVQIVRRPEMGRREVDEEGVLDMDLGLVGDNWKARASASDGSVNLRGQLAVMNSRFLSLIAQSEERWELAGDQLIVDLDLSMENLPPGLRLSVGEAVLEISEHPHTGCAKFSARFGQDALRFVSTPSGRDLRLRGVYARIVQSGAIRAGDTVTKLPA